jgi:spore maturation protein CgeB
MNSKKLKYLWIYSAADQWVVDWHNKNLKRRQDMGYNIVSFCTTIPYLNNKWLPFPELDLRWKCGDTNLLTMYEDLAKQIICADVLVLYNGANLHPDFISSFKNVYKIYTCGDPESLDSLAKPVVEYFDLHLVNQINLIEIFKSWGLPKVNFWPLGSITGIEEVKDLNEDNLKNISLRPHSTVLFAEYNNWRKTRMDAIASAFPNSLLGGRGWGIGFVNYDFMFAAYRKAQIGWNLHNTSGFNFRTYDLLANGVLQICDNKQELENILQINNEVIGYDTIEEAIDLTHFYLEHPEEQRRIALAGWQRWKRDYTPDRTWEKLVEIVEKNYPQDFVQRSTSVDLSNFSKMITAKRKNSKYFKYIYPARKFVMRTKRFLKRKFFGEKY